MYTFQQPVGSIGLIPVRVPVENCVDGSTDAVSVYAAAVGLIHNINRNEAQLNGEFERGKSKIIASADMFKKDKHGRREITDDMFVGLDDDQETVGITIFSPELREASYLARKQDYLRSVENIIGLKRGLLSEVEAVERTAKEITSSEGDYSLTIGDFQKMWEDAVREAMRVCGILGQLYKVPGAHEVADDQVVISWGNGVLFDEEKTRQRMLSEVQAGLLQPERYLGFAYNLPCDTPAQRARIRKDYMPEVEETGEDE
jgi:A118 family predicted phage portal protein